MGTTALSHRRRFGVRWSLVAALLLGVALAVGAGRLKPVSAQPTTVRLSGHTLDVLSNATKLAPASAARDGTYDAATGSTPGDQPLTLTLILNRTDEAGFQRFLADMQDPKSAGAGQYLTQQQLADRFGPSQKAYDAVLSWLQGQGFSLTQGSANRLTLTVNGTRQQAQQAFGVNIDDYTLDGKSFFANDQNPAVPASIGSYVQAVQGLSSLAQPRAPQGLVVVLACPLVLAAAILFILATPEAPAIVTPELLALRAALFSTCGMAAAVITAYIGCLIAADGNSARVAACNKVMFGASPIRPSSTGPNTAAAPATPFSGPPAQKVGLLEYDTYHPSDVANWLGLFSAYNASQASRLSAVPVNGGLAAPGPDESEVLLDADLVLFQTDPTTNVVVYDAPASTSFQTLFNAMINDGDTVISNSWSYCEDETTQADVQSLKSVLDNAVAAHISVFNGSGDHGSTCLDGSPNTVGVPADLPNATAVGGSTMTPGAGATYGHERWWDGSQSTPVTGQGGFGVSKFFPRPSYQDGQTTATGRSVPDTVMPADPAQGLGVCQADAGGCPNGLLHGGTSMSAPEWAVVAVSLNKETGQNLGFLNPRPYPKAGTVGFHTAASMSSDFAHVGLGSPNPDELRLLLLGQTADAVDPVSSPVRTLPTAVADGSTQAVVQVNLLDSHGRIETGKTVSLVAQGVNHAHISAPSGSSSVNGGAVTFSVTDTVPETLTFTLTDTTDNVPLQAQPTIQFVTPPATAAGIGAVPVPPASVQADGTHTGTVTVTLKDAKGQPSSGKSVTLAQGDGHSIASGSGLSDAGGKAVFTVTDTVAESVTYTATDVTDGSLPVPGSATVSFTRGGTTKCPVIAPHVAAGYAVTTIVSGFANCGAPFGLSFDGSGNLFVDDLRNGFLLKFGPAGGTVTAANHVGSYNSLDPDGLAFGKDGKLYMGLLNTGGVWEVNPATGAFVRQVAGSLPFPLGLAFDPISGDLFVSIGANSNSIYRISNLAADTPTVALYSSVGNADGLAFAPDGTLYAAINLPPPGDPTLDTIVKIAGTNTGNAGAVLATIATVPGVDGLGLATTAGGGVVIYGNRNDGTITKLDFTQNDPGSGQPPLRTDIFTGGSRGDFATVGPDGCLYATQTDRILKVTNADGSCTLDPSGAQPSLSLSPGTTAPNPAQGTATTLTAALHNVSSPEGTYVTFVATGANTVVKQVQADSNGVATFTYSGVHTGADTVIAVASPGGNTITSNHGSVTWVAAGGKHTSFVTLNPSATAGAAHTTATLTGNLSDVSASPVKALGGQHLQFTLGSGPSAQQCSATTAANGNAACKVTLSLAPGSYPLSVSYAGGATVLGSSDARTFDVAPNLPRLTYAGDTTATHGAAAHLAARLVDAGGAPLAGREVRFTLGSDPTAERCSGPTDATGKAGCDSAPLQQLKGSVPLSVAFAGEADYAAVTASATVTVKAAPGEAEGLLRFDQTALDFVVRPHTEAGATVAPDSETPLGTSITRTDCNNDAALFGHTGPPQATWARRSYTLADNVGGPDTLQLLVGTAQAGNGLYLIVESVSEGGPQLTTSRNCTLVSWTLTGSAVSSVQQNSDLAATALSPATVVKASWQAAVDQTVLEVDQPAPKHTLTEDGYGLPVFVPYQGTSTMLVIPLY